MTYDFLYILLKRSSTKLNETSYALDSNTKQSIFVLSDPHQTGNARKAVMMCWNCPVSGSVSKFAELKRNYNCILSVQWINIWIDNRIININFPAIITHYPNRVKQLRYVFYVIFVNELI